MTPEGKKEIQESGTLMSKCCSSTYAGKQCVLEEGHEGYHTLSKADLLGSHFTWKPADPKEEVTDISGQSENQEPKKERIAQIAFSLSALELLLGFSEAGIRIKQVRREEGEWKDNERYAHFLVECEQFPEVLDIERVPEVVLTVSSKQNGGHIIAQADFSNHPRYPNQSHTIRWAAHDAEQSGSDDNWKLYALQLELWIEHTRKKTLIACKCQGGVHKEITIEVDPACGEEIRKLADSIIESRRRLDSVNFG